MKPQKDSEVVEEVRKRAMRISKRFGHDAKKYLAHLKAAQKRNPEKLVRQMTVV